MIPVTDLTTNPQILKKIRLAIDEVVKSNSYILSQQLEKFESEFGEFIGSKFICGVGSGTDSLTLSLKALGIGVGDKVLTVSFTSPFTIIAILEAGAIPVFCDIDPNGWTIDVAEASRKMDLKVKAIMPVHIYGNPCDMKKVLDFAKDAKIKVVEDACQANGAMIEEKLVGTFGDAGAFSFYPTKNLGAFGDGGAVTTNNKSVFAAVKILRHGGQTKRFWHVSAYPHSRLDEIQAAILRVKLSVLSDENTMREKIAARYRDKLSALKLRFQKIIPKAKSANHLFVIATKERDRLKKYLKQHGVGSDIHYPYPTYRQPAFKEFADERLDVTEEIQAKILSLPIYPSLKETDQDEVISQVKNFFVGKK